MEFDLNVKNEQQCESIEIIKDKAILQENNNASFNYFIRPKLNEQQNNKLSGLIRKFPMTIQAIEEIDDNNSYFIDKTHIILNLVNNLKKVYIIRPRRFGKSTTISVIEEMFKGFIIFNI